MVNALLMLSMVLVATFLILLVLVQRGRGGGLTGALGGMGGQSAFGTKAGDLFTRITVVTALVWGLLCILAVTYYNRSDTFSSSFGAGAAPTSPTAPAGPGLPGAPVPGVPKGGTLPPIGGAPKAPVSGLPAIPETPGPK
ncbi:MAG TPA: preprotein translocase subunit SecG [Pirellulales bacterium]|jgi:preprotein translocase subunit SecG